MKFQFRKIPEIILPDRLRQVLEFHFQVPRLARLRRHPLAIFKGHGQAAGKEIAQIVGQIRVYPADEGRLVKHGIQAVDHLPQKEIPHLIQAVLPTRRCGSTTLPKLFDIFPWPICQ